MASVYSRRLYSVSGISHGDGPAETPVPAGKVMVVRDVRAYSGDIGAPVLVIQDIDTGGTWLAYQGPELTKAHLDWEGHVVFESGGFAVYPDSGTWDVYVSGYLLNA